MLISLKLNNLIDMFSKANHHFLKFLFYSKFPIPFILIISILSLGESGTDLISNPVLSGMYFMFGYQIYNNNNLQNIVRNWKYYALIIMAIIQEVFIHYHQFFSILLDYVF